MRTVMLLFAAISIAGLAGSDQAATSKKADVRAAEDEARLTEALKGRVAGPTQDCIVQSDVRSQQGYGRSAILFAAQRSDVVYVNRPRSGCPDIGGGRALETRTTSSRLCRGDVVRVLDPLSQMQLEAARWAPSPPTAGSRSSSV